MEQVGEIHKKKNAVVLCTITKITMRWLFLGMEEGHLLLWVGAGGGCFLVNSDLNKLN